MSDTMAVSIINMITEIIKVITNEYKATVDIRTCEIMTGDLPSRQTKLVLAWAELHQDELMANWKLVTNGENPFKI